MPASKTPKRPVSPRQLAANRANAARSTGPRSPEGKARSSQNARRHGFAAADYTVVRLEDLEAVARLKDDLVHVYQPVNSQELFAIERIALAQHALLRCARLESGLFTTCLNEALDRTGNPIVPMTEDLVGDLEITRAQNRNYALAEGFRRFAREGNTWTLFLRYQAQTERLYRRAMEEFERLKALRPELPNEPDFGAQPEEKTTASAPPETNPVGGPVPPAPCPDPAAAPASARTPASSVPVPKPDARRTPSGGASSAVADRLTPYRESHRAPVRNGGPAAIRTPCRRPGPCRHSIRGPNPGPLVRRGHGPLAPEAPPGPWPRSAAEKELGNPGPLSAPPPGPGHLPRTPQRRPPPGVRYPRIHGRRAASSDP